MIGSAWSAWWHPKQAFRELEHLRQEISILRESLSEMGDERTGLLKGITQSKEQLADFAQLRESLEREVTGLREINEQQRQRLESWEEASTEMERVASQLEKMVTLRERMHSMRLEYEDRIAKLERQLWSAKSGGLQYAKPGPEDTDIADSDLFDPRDMPMAPPLPIRMAEDRPKIEPAKGDDSDWLLSVPPSI